MKSTSLIRSGSPAWINVLIAGISNSIALLLSPMAQEIKPAGKNPKVITALERIDRAQFLPESLKGYADMDSSLPLSDGGRIPSKTEIAFVLDSISTFENPKVLIIGNNTGYCASVFAQIYPKIYIWLSMACIASSSR